MEPNLPLVFDGHNDTLLNLHLPDRGEGRTFFGRSELGHIDLPRAREGAFGGGFFACYAPTPEDDGWNEESALTVTEDGYVVSDAPPLDPTYARGFADELVALLFELESEGGLRIVRTAEELEGCLREGNVAAILHFEGAENLGPDPGALEELYEVGLRSLGLVWSRPNAYAHGVPFRFPPSHPSSRERAPIKVALPALPATSRSGLNAGALRPGSRSDHILLFLNIVFLMCVAFVPFATALLADYISGTDDHRTTAVYSGTLPVTALFFTTLWLYAAGNHRLVDRAVDPLLLRAMTRRYVFGMLLYILAFALAFFSAAASLALIFVLPEPKEPGGPRRTRRPPIRS